MREDTSRLVYSTDQGNIKEKSSGGGKNKTSAGAIHSQSGSSSGQNQRQKIHLRLERKGRGGKTVTLVCGLCLPERELEPLLKDIKTRLGTGGSLKEKILELQGDHRDTITGILREKGFRI